MFVRIFLIFTCMHLALILDGNRRWARARGLPAAYGHHRGVQNLKNLLPALLSRGVQTVTAYALSTENLRERDSTELANLFAEIQKFAAEQTTFHAHEIRVQILGELADFPADVRATLAALVAATAGYEKLTLNLALGYGGRAEIVRAAALLAAEARAFSEENFADALYSAGQTDPDLLIRTGGKQRLSNFLPWQLAYTELYFTPKFWPEFDAAELDAALAWYAAQQRNFGK